MGILKLRSPQLRRLAIFTVSGGVVSLSFAFGFVTVTLLIVLGFIPASVRAVSIQANDESRPATSSPAGDSPAVKTWTVIPETDPVMESLPAPPTQSLLLADSLHELKAAQAKLEEAREIVVARDEALASLEARVESLTGQLAKTDREVERLEASLAAIETEEARERKPKMDRSKPEIETEFPLSSEAIASLPKPPATSTPEEAPPGPTDSPAVPRIAPILYPKGSAVNYEDRDRVIEDVKTALDAHPGAMIVLTGHANDSPHALTNLDISRNRANFLAAYLRQSGGVPREQIEVEALGGTKPGDGDPAAGRRVEIVVQP